MHVVIKLLCVLWELQKLAFESTNLIILYFPNEINTYIIKLIFIYLIN